MNASVLPLPPELHVDDPDGRHTEAAYLAVIHDAILNHPRSLQTAIGPSEIGTPCDRKIAYKLLRHPERPQPPAWLPTIGTGVHSWLEDAFDQGAYRELLASGGDQERWLTETRVTVGYIPGMGFLEGSCDLYDRYTGTVVDHKGLSLDTPIPTPSGWTTMGELAVGDQVFDRDGRVTNVTHVFPDNHRDCYRIMFEDGTTVIADDIHEWVVSHATKGEVTLSTAQLADQAFSTAPRPQRQLRINNAGALDLPDAALPIPPYTLGAWLGDGTQRGGLIGKPDDDLFARIEQDGFVVGPADKRGMTRRIEGLTAMLRAAGLIQNKHVPAEYLRASRAQRLDLLRGLMDTDGSWNRPRKQAVFCSTDPALAAAAAELVQSLGWRCTIAQEKATGFGITTTAHKVYFVPFGDNPFHLPRKADLVRVDGSARCRRRIVQSVERVESVTTRCVEVDSPSHTYLCTTAMIPTHNCVGPSSLKKYKASGPGDQYRTQAHLYGKGWANRGHKVTRVAISFLPRNDQLTGRYWWSEPYDPTIADNALARLARIHGAVAAVGAPVLAALPIADDHCLHCPFLATGSTDPANGCPGHSAAGITKTTPALTLSAN